MLYNIGSSRGCTISEAVRIALSHITEAVHDKATLVRLYVPKPHIVEAIHIKATDGLCNVSCRGLLSRAPRLLVTVYDLVITLGRILDHTITRL